MLTAEQVQSIMPGLSAKRNGEFLPFLQAAMTEFAIEAPARAAAFLAQLAHESGQFRFMEEIWGPTAAQRRYEPPSSLATTLGNTEAGDGKRFKGRGPIQITGRANYRRFGDLLGVDMVSDPARAGVPDLAFRIASLFWSKKGLNELADRATADAFREITRRINGGFNGLEDRKKFYAVACTVLGVSEVPAERGRGTRIRSRLRSHSQARAHSAPPQGPAGHAQDEHWSSQSRHAPGKDRLSQGEDERSRKDAQRCRRPERRIVAIARENHRRTPERRRDSAEDRECPAQQGQVRGTAPKARASEVVNSDQVTRPPVDLAREFDRTRD